MKILFATPAESWAAMIKKEIASEKYEVIGRFNLMEIIHILKTEKVSICFLDLSFKNPSGLDLMVTIKENFPLVKIILLKSEEQREMLGDAGPLLLAGLGIADVLVHPVRTQEIMACLEGHIQCTEMMSLQYEALATSHNMKDADMLEISIDDCQSGNTGWFDLYHKTGASTYQQLLEKGHFFAPKNWQDLSQQNLTHFYFKKSAKDDYVRYVADVALRMGGRPFKKNSLEMNFGRVSKSLAAHYFKDLPDDVLRAVKEVCNQTGLLLKMNPEIHRLFSTFQKEASEDEFVKMLLTVHYAAIIATRLEWMGKKTLERIIFGAFLHDVGILGLPVELRVKCKEAMNPEERSLYEKHPMMGIQMLSKVTDLEEAIRQIVYQHHESADGTGFPNGLTNMKTYPLAKIVALADYMGDKLVQTEKAPLEVLRLFIFDKKATQKFDTDMIRVLIKAFMKQENPVKVGSANKKIISRT